MATTFTYVGALPERVACFFSVALEMAPGEVGPLADPVMYLNGSRSSLTPELRIADVGGLAAASPQAPSSNVVATTNPAAHLTSFPDGSILFVDGRQVRRLSTRGVETLLTLNEREGDIAGLAVDPQFEQSGLVLLCLSESTSDPRFANRVVRYREVGGSLGEPAVIASGLPRPAHGQVPMFISIDGRVLVAIGRLAQGETPYANQILQFGLNGRPLAADLGHGPAISPAPARPLAVAAMAGGSIVVADEHEGLLRSTGSLQRLPLDSVDRQNQTAYPRLLSGSVLSSAPGRAALVDGNGTVFLVSEGAEGHPWETTQVSVGEGWAAGVVHLTERGTLVVAIRSADGRSHGLLIVSTR